MFMMSRALMTFRAAKSVTTILPCLLCFVVGLVSLSCIHAFPSGAGGSCNGGMAAVGGSHTSAAEKTGSLSDGGLELVINDAYILNPSSLSILEVGATYSVSLNGGPFRGVLIRMEGGGISMTPARNFQVADVCTQSNVIGLTHTENSVKSGLTSIGNFIVSFAQQFTVDVTVVVANNADEGSEYYYSVYSLEAANQIPSDIPMPATLPNSIMTENAPSKSSMSTGVIIALIFAAALVICAFVGTFLYYRKLQSNRNPLRATSSSAEFQDGLEAPTVEAEIASYIDVYAAPIQAGAATNPAVYERGSAPNDNDDETSGPLATQPSQRRPFYKDQVQTIMDPQLQVLGVADINSDGIPVVTARISERALLDEPESDRKPRHRQDP